MKAPAAIGVFCSLFILSSAPALATSQETRATPKASVESHVPANASQQKVLARVGRRWTGQARMERGDREVWALNLLEAAGYRQFADVTRKGAVFFTTASKHGQLYSVTVAANGAISASEM